MSLLSNIALRSTRPQFHSEIVPFDDAPTALTVSSGGAIRMAYTFGDDLVSGPQYRSTMEQELRRMLSGATGISDEALSEAVRTCVAAFVCIEFKSQSVSEVPLMVNGPGNETVNGHPFDYFLTNAPELIEKVNRSLEIYGIAFLRKRYNRHGFPSGLEFLNKPDVQVLTDNEQNIIAYNLTLTHEYGVDPSEVIDIPLFDPTDRNNGLSPLEVAFADVNVGRAVKTHAAAFFFNSARPDGLLSFELPMTPVQFEAAKDEWRRHFKGPANAHRTAVMPPGAKWTPMQSAPVDLAMTELIDNATQYTCAVFQVPPALVGLGDVSDPLSASSTLTEARRGFIEMVAVPRANKIVRELTRQWSQKDFSPRNYYRIVTDATQMSILSNVTGERVSTSTALTGSNIFDYDEARQLLGYAERGDDYPLKRATAEPSRLWNDGAVLLNEYRTMVGLRPLMAGGDVLLSQGKLIPVGRLVELADATVNLAVNPQIMFGGAPQLPVGSEPAPANEPPNVSAASSPALPAPALSVPTRAIADTMPLTFAVNLADNQFVRYARRALADVLPGNVQWIPDTEWRIELAQVQDWTPADAVRVLRTLELDDAPKVDVWTAGYILSGDSIYLALELSEGLTRFHKALDLELSTLKVDAIRAEVVGIRLCVAPGVTSEQLQNLPEQRYPLVLNNVTLFMDSQAHHRWPLRGVSPAQFKELKNWRHVAERKGRDHEFKPETLAISPITEFVRWGLVQDCPLERVFDTAESMLTGTLPTVAIQDGDVLDTPDSPRVLDSLQLRSKANYKRALRAAVRGLWGGVLSTQQFLDAMESSIDRAFNQAWNEGISKEGLTETDLSEDEINRRTDTANQEKLYIMGFAEAISENNQQRGGALEPLFQRAELWLNRYDSVMELATLVAARDKKKRWVWDSSVEQHCRDCERLNGKIFRAKIWLKYDIRPASASLECFSNCKCRFEDTDGPITPGRPPNLIGRRSADHDHDHDDLEDTEPPNVGETVL